MTDTPPKNLKAEQLNKAIDCFKDWSNYLLVTTVAALAWVTTEQVEFCCDQVRIVCIACFAFSIVFAIFTLALIPLVAERIEDDTHSSIYDIKVSYKVVWWMWDAPNWLQKLKAFCWPQHVSFMAGIVIYAIGTALA